MNIKDLAKRAIERINSTSLEELKNKFIKHGYKDDDYNLKKNNCFMIYSSTYELICEECLLGNKDL